MDDARTLKRTRTRPSQDRSPPSRQCRARQFECSAQKRCASAAGVVRSRADQNNRLIPDTTVDVRFETVFPAMPFRPASLPLAEHVQRLYAEAGGTAKINRVSIGAGTDAAFAALETKAPVIEGMGLLNFGAHTNNAEYVNISSIEPRLFADAVNVDIAAGRA